MTNRLLAPSRRDLLRTGKALAMVAPMPGPLAPPAAARNAAFSDLLDLAAGPEAMETLIIAREGRILAERGHSPSVPTKIQTASIPIIASLVRIAVKRGVLPGVDKPIATLWRTDRPANADPWIEETTSGQMRDIVPRLGLSVVMTPDDTPHPTTIADRDNLHAPGTTIIERVRTG